MKKKELRSKKREKNKPNKTKKADEKKQKFLDVVLRYTILVLIAFPNLYLFYLVFAPLTVYPVYFLLGLFVENISLIGRAIIIKGTEEFAIEIINACIAGSAYYLLLILNLSTPKINFKKRISMISLSFAALLIINILRIFSLSLVFLSGYSFFDLAHRLFWYAGSIIFVVGIWFAEVRFFKIRAIPFYSDISSVYKKANIKNYFSHKNVI